MSLNIVLFDNWVIKSDRWNYILTNGKERYFYCSLESLFDAFLVKQMRGFDSKSIEQLNQDLKRLVDKLNLALQPLHYKLEPVKAGEVNE